MPSAARRRTSSATTSSIIPKVERNRDRSRVTSRTCSNDLAAWTARDDHVLASARAAGLNWQPLADQYFPTKSANACRKRHERLMERRYQEEWDQDRLDALAIAYADCRMEMWTMLADRLDERWGIMEGKCMEVGLKNLQSIARATQRKRIRLAEDKADVHDFAADQDHEGDSGIGLCCDAEIGLSPPGRPASAPVRPSSSATGSEPARQAPELPLYLPPPSVMFRHASNKSLRSTSLTPQSGPVCKAYAPSRGRDVLSIQSILCPPDQAAVV